MKPATLFSVTSLFTLGNLAAARISQAEAELECGDLGAMNISALPENIDLETVRVCNDHPKRSVETELMARDCYEGDKSNGCTDGYCWKKCQNEDGPWCWTAGGNGYGDWIDCDTDGDCSDDDACGVGDGDCTACGCGC